MRTALLLDSRFQQHPGLVGHPEQPERIACLLPMRDDPGRPDVVPITPRPASREEIEAVHTPQHWERIAASQGQAETSYDFDTSAGPDSFEIARLAAGGVIELLDTILDGRADNGLALVRPPGHHAESDRVMGFCLFNNIAIGAAHLLRRGLTRVAIVDWDVHHGNGTQEIFQRDGRVLFASMHQFPLYPGTGRAEERGMGDGEGTTFNLPLPAGGGDDEYLAAFDDWLLPALRDFDPEFVLVSAGFDAHERDPLGGMQVTTEGFATFTRRLMDLARTSCADRLALVLEGGYDLDALVASTRAVALELGRPSKTPEEERPSLEAER